MSNHYSLAAVETVARRVPLAAAFPDRRHLRSRATLATSRARLGLSILAGVVAILGSQKIAAASSATTAGGQFEHVGEAR